jgi:hypothetical protein
METTKTDYTKLETVIYFDSVGRLLIAAKSSNEINRTSVEFEVISPAVIDLVPGRDPGQLGIRIVPIILPDLLASNDVRPTVKYPRNSVVITDAVIDNGIVENYRKTLLPPSQIIVPQSNQVLPAAEVPQTKRINRSH